jgi:hypothetical protein
MTHLANRISHVLAAALLALMATATGAIAENLNPDGLTIANCLKAEVGKGASGVVCIGIVADPCLAALREKDGAAAEAVTCSAREIAVWQLRLRQAGQSASKAGGKKLAAALAASQRRWSESMKQLCPLFENLDPGMSPGGANYCILQETAMRALMLERLAEAVNPH